MKLKINWDFLGIATSILCAIHCAVLPLFVAALPLFGINIIENHAFEAGMIGLAVVVGSYALWHGYRWHHRSKTPLALFAIGIVFLILKQVFLHLHEILLIPAVLFIVLAHFYNYRYCRKHARAHSAGCHHKH